MLKSFDEYVSLAEQAHGHLCAGQLLGVRLALHGLKLLELDDPTGRDRKRLVTFVEIDRCDTDAIGLVTGCRLGKRALKFADFGKMAATFCDLQEGRAVRVAAKESAKQRAREMFPAMESPAKQQMLAYRELPEEELFEVQWVRVALKPEDLPGYKAAKAVCSECGESISFKREVVRHGEVLCRACAGERYYDVLPEPQLELPGESEP